MNAQKPTHRHTTGTRAAVPAPNADPTPRQQALAGRVGLALSRGETAAGPEGAEVRHGQ